MTVQVEQLITEHLDLWTQAQTAKSTSGRGSNNKIELTGIKKLRELILELAVRGKLVPQDPNDEPASELLKRIAAEKEALVKAGKLKKQKPLPPITDKEKPFELPVGWEWCRLDQLSFSSEAGWSPQCANLPREGLKWGVLKVSAVTWGIYQENENKALPEHLEPKPEFEVKPGDFLISRANTAELVARAVVVPETAAPKLILSDKIIRFKFSQLISSEYINLVNNSSTARSYYAAVAGGTSSSMKNVSRPQIQHLLIPLPTKIEQVKILAKVNELMALCDQLEQQSYQQLDAHNQLVDALLATLTQSQNADELASNWQRLAAHFDTLFTTEYSIDALKQTILQLAVMGKLVKQDPNDEPASELLKRIAAEKDALVKAGKIKKQKPLPPISDEEKPFELPEGWEWCRLMQLGLTSTGKTPSTSNSAYFDGEVPFIGPGQINQNGEILASDKFLTEPGVLESTESMPGDILTVCIGGSIGKSAITKNRIAFNQQINAISPILVGSSYLYFAMCTEQFKKSILNSSSGSATPIINRSKWESLPVPIPPSNEQIRIVQMIDLLFDICTNCSKKMEETKQIQAVLAEALVEQVVN